MDRFRFNRWDTITTETCARNQLRYTARVQLVGFVSKECATVRFTESHPAGTLGVNALVVESSLLRAGVYPCWTFWSFCCMLCYSLA